MLLNAENKHHNKHFLPLALQALQEVEEEMQGETVEKLVNEAFNGRLADFILKRAVD